MSRFVEVVVADPGRFAGGCRLHQSGGAGWGDDRSFDRRFKAIEALRA
ncbi:MAG: hypothetical protein OEM84_05165 [Acidimicrobiia bacterium]|nr:hypothetical protein [Acidimicrobiia bacterium]